MTGRFSRNTVLAGFFVLACIGLFVLVILMLTSAGDRLIGKRRYVVQFTIAEGAEGLERGSLVKLGGQRIGRVVSSDLAFAPDKPDPVGIDVTIEVWSRLQLYEDATVNLVRPLLGSNSVLNISSLKAREDSKPVAEGGRIRGQIGPPGFLTQADYARVQDIIARVDQMSAEIQPHVKPVAENIERTIANAAKISDDATSVAGNIKARWEEWSTQISTVVARVEKGSEPIERIATRVREGVDTGSEFLDRANKLLGDNRAAIDDTINSARELMRKAQGEAYDKVIAILDNARSTSEYVQDVSRRADELLITRGPELDQIVAHASLAAQQLKLATVEIRAAPWRLLYQPNKKELENELLYNSIRQYSESLSQLRAAAESLESATKQVAAGTAAGAVSPQTLADLTAKLKDSLSQSAEQERRFFERWVREDK